MAKTLAERLAHARAGTGPDLADATEQLNASLARAEKALVDLKLAVSATINLEPETPDGVYNCLSFERRGPGWGLFISWGIAGDPDAGEVKPILRASRDDRLLAAEHLPELVNELIRRAEAKADEVRQAARQVDSFVDELAAATTADVRTKVAEQPTRVGKLVLRK